MINNIQNSGSNDLQLHKRTLIVILDGWTKSIMMDLLDRNELPEIQRHIIDNGGILSNVISNLPSVSVASHMSILSSKYQDEHGIPGHRWLDKTSGKVNSYFSLDGAKRANKDSNSLITTIYESSHYASSISIQGVIYRGAKIIKHLPTMNSYPILKKTASLLINHPNSVVVTWLPRLDALSHKYGPDSVQVVNEMKETSKALGKVIENFVDSDILDDLRILLIPDHGQRKVEKIANLKSIFSKININAIVNPRVNHSNKQLILTSGDSSAQVYLEEKYLEQRHNIAQKLCAYSEIELICWFEGTQWFFCNKLGVSCTKQIGHSDNIEYNLISGNDPLGILADNNHIVLNLSTPQINIGYYPDFIHQVMRSYIPDRSGDMILFPSHGFHFGKAPRFGYGLGFHKGSHGGPLREEVVVSAIYKGFEGIEDKPIRSANLLNYLNVF